MNYIPIKRIRLEDETMNKLIVTKKLLKNIDPSFKNLDVLINRAVDSLLKEYVCQTIECNTNAIL